MIIMSVEFNNRTIKLAKFWVEKVGSSGLIEETNDLSRKRNASRQNCPLGKRGDQPVDITHIPFLCTHCTNHIYLCLCPCYVAQRIPFNVLLHMAERIFYCGSIKVQYNNFSQPDSEVGSPNNWIFSPLIHWLHPPSPESTPLHPALHRHY